MKKQESGRSMFEMLCVLGVASILSIGGIMGYSSAMNRFQAAKIIDLSNKYALHVFELCRKIHDNGKTGLLAVKYCSPATPGMHKFEDTRLGTLPPSVYDDGISFSKVIEKEGGSFEISIDHKLNSKEVCESIKSVTHQQYGCTENEAPFTVTVSFGQS